MKFQEFRPALPLQPYVHQYAILENHRENPEGFTEYSPPSLNTGLLFYYHLESPLIVVNGVYDASLPASYIMPQCMHNQQWLYHKPFGIFAIIFKPGKLRYFFPYPLFEFQDRPLPLSECEEKDLMEMEHKILEAKTIAERIQFSDDFLINRLRYIDKKPDLIDWALPQLFLNPASHLKDLSLRVKISERQFRRIFEREVGTNPKSWQKLARFSQALYMLQNQPYQKLFDVAYACGYYDQTQFIEQFKFFTTITPGQFVKRIMPIAELTAWREDVVDNRLISR